MTRRAVHFVLVWLLVAGVLAQAVIGANPPGHSLCIGCGPLGWSIGPACDPEQGVDCCDEHDDPCLVHSDSIAGQGSSCGCFDVPLAGGSAASVSFPRCGSSDGPPAQLVAMHSCLLASTILDLDAKRPLLAIEAPPYRCATPLTLRTVLVL